MKQISTTETPVTSDDAPKVGQADFDRARFRVAGKEATRAEWQLAVRARVAKLRVNIMLDAPIVDHFKAMAGDRGYQTLINDTLRRVIETGHLEADLRRVIREELHAGAGAIQADDCEEPA
jgi:uncharacterized protein (DUF4415 family)